MAKKREFKSAEVVSDSEGRQYHIGCKPGDIAPYILMCGDPARAHLVASYFDKANAPITHREYVTISGVYKKIPITVMATGMGPDNTEMAVVEISQIVENPTMFRIGSSGGLMKGLGLGDLVVSTGAVRLENTSTFFVFEGYPAVAHHECVLALIQAAHNLKMPHHVGLTATAPGFYGAQARRVPGFPPRDESLPAKLDAMNVLNLEMETSCLFSLATLKGLRTGAVCAVYNNRHLNVFADENILKLAEKRCVETGLEAVRVIASMDSKKKKVRNWLPEMGM